MKSFNNKALCAAAALLAVFGGCISLERSYPDKHYFALEVRAPELFGRRFKNDTLQVSNLRISPRYQDRSFLYRISETGFESDFYNQFIAPPAGLISEELRKSLSGTQLFKHVIGQANSQAPSYMLEGVINGIYGDFRNLQAPAAIIDLEFFLTSDLPTKPGILMQKRYVKSVPVSNRSPDALVKSWDLALEEIFHDLAADLGAVK